MMSSLYRWFRPRSRTIVSRAGGRKKPICQLHVESLEDRAVPTAGFAFTDFSDISNLTLLGDAAVTSGNVLRLTPAVGGQEGAAWLTADKQFVGTAFDTSFQFQMTENADPPGGSDGFAFIIQNTAPTFLSGGGGTLGYYGLKNSLAVEFDTYQNPEVGDQSQSSISVHTNGTGANDWSESLSIGSYNTNPIMDDATVHSAKIAYSPGTLSIYLDNMTTPKLTVAVDLAEKLDLDAGKAWVGFTATTGGGWQNHDILNWNYNVIPPVTTTVWLSDASVIEGNIGTKNLVFTINRSGDTSGAATVNWTTENRTATAGSDYSAASGQATFAANEAQATVSISVSGDTTLEPNETLALRLSAASGATISDGVGIGTIITDDVGISIADASAIEGSIALKTLDRFVADGSGGLARPRGSIFGPDGNGDGVQDLYVSSADTNEILRYDGRNGAFLGTFVTAGSGGLNSPVDQAFGPDGLLYVSSYGSGELLRYDGSTGAFVDRIASGISNLEGITFGSDGRLYIASQGTNEILRYDGSGLSVFVSAGSGGLDNPRQAVFGPDGNLYVACQLTQQILRYNGTSGAFMNVFASTAVGGAGNLAWIESGGDGYLYAAVRTSPTSNDFTMLRFNSATGALFDSVNLGQPGWSFIVGQDGFVYESGNAGGNFVDRLGPSSIAAFTVSLSAASATPVTVNFATANGSAIAGSDFTTKSGTLTFAPGETSKTIIIQTIDDGVHESTETFNVNITNAVGATITDSQGVATITDNDWSYISISDVTMAEGKNKQTTVFSFTVTLSQPSDQPVTVSYQTVNGTATTANKDYVAKTGTITFAPGETTKTITIVVNGDNTPEGNELFYVDLFGNSRNSLFTKKRGVGTILNDD